MSDEKQEKIGDRVSAEVEVRVAELKAEFRSALAKRDGDHAVHREGLELMAHQNDERIADLEAKLAGVVVQKATCERNWRMWERRAHELESLLQQAGVTVAE